MQPQITLLLVEHKNISDQLSEIEEIFSERKEGFLGKALKSFQVLKAMAMQEHHKNEDEILFSWLLTQSAHPDTSVIDHFRKEHVKLEALHEKIMRDLKTCLLSESPAQVSNLSYDVTDFLDSYREHMQKEEKFLFLIGEGLLSKSHSRAG